MSFLEENPGFPSPRDHEAEPSMEAREVEPELDGEDEELIRWRLGEAFQKREGLRIRYDPDQVSRGQVESLQAEFSHFQFQATRAKPNPKIEPFFVELSLVEIKTHALKQWGLRFGSPLDFDLSIRPQSLQFFKVQGINPIGGLIDMALDRGEATVHFKQSLVGLMGEKASFHVGGEFPVRVSSRYHTGLEKISYGVELQVLPQRVDAERLRLQIHVDAREPMGAGLDQLPQISQKRLRTRVVCRWDESFAVAGMFRSSKSKAQRGVPFLSEIPGLGRLLSSHDFQQNKSEAYLFLTPRHLKSPWNPQGIEK